jgi:Type I restriction enzyme R protein N terminus (HSDR_N)
MSIAITDAITTIAEAEQRLSLARTEDEAFFPEWQVDLPALSVDDGLALGNVRRRYLYQRTEGQLLEGTVMLLLVSPLLTVAGFYDPPFRIRAEESVRLDLTDSEQVLAGRIDVLVVMDGLWVVVLEAKKTALSVWGAVPQTLAYLKGNPQAAAPSFGLVTNGDEIVFVKAEAGRYGVSRVFSPIVSRSELEMALQVLKRLSVQRLSIQ